MRVCLVFACVRVVGGGRVSVVCVCACLYVF